MKNNILFLTLTLIFLSNILSAQVQVRFEATPYQIQFFEYSKSDNIEIDYQTKIESTEVESILSRALHFDEYNNSKGYFITGKGYDKYLKNNEKLGPAMPLSLLPKLHKGIKIVPIYKVRLLKDDTERIIINVEMFYKDEYIGTKVYQAIKTKDGWKRIPSGISGSPIDTIVGYLNAKAFHQIFVEQKGNELITELLGSGKNPFNDQIWLNKLHWHFIKNSKKFKSFWVKLNTSEDIWWEKYVE